MSVQTPLIRRLGITVPIIQAPMAGGGDTPALVAAVCEAGGLGSIGATYLTAEKILDACKQVRAKTSRPFGINLFAPMPQPAADAPVAKATARVAPFYTELGLPAPQPPTWNGDTFESLLPAVLESGAAVFSFTFGLIPPEALKRVRARGMLIAGTATTVEEAIALEAAGVDAVVAQGGEAGGHRGTFTVPFEQALVGTIALVPQIADAVRVPVIASGGIMDGRGIAAALALGADAVQMGTAFLTCDEAGIPETYKQAILASREDGTKLTRAFSGRPARGIVNRFMREIEREPETILPFPLQNTLTRPMRTAAAQQGKTEYLSLWAGQGTRMARRQPAKVLMERLVNEYQASRKRMAGDTP